MISFLMVLFYVFFLHFIPHYFLSLQLSIFCLPYPTLPYPTLPYPTLPCPALPCPALPYPTLPYPTPPSLPYPSLLCPTLPCPALPCPALFCCHRIINVSSTAHLLGDLETVRAKNDLMLTLPGAYQAWPAYG